MGKKDKKRVKSEVINALKRHYDTFLEEEKKRKERNEFILGRLDQMRSTIFTVSHHRPPTESKIIQNSYCPEPANPKHENELRIIPRQNMALVPMTSSGRFLDEQLLLQQISKKYILIPKLESDRHVPDETEFCIPKEIDDKNNENDWKRKYEILSKLKKSEKDSEYDPVSNASVKTIHDKSNNKDFADLCKGDYNEIPDRDHETFKKTLELPKKLGSCDKKYSTYEEQATGKTDYDLTERAEIDKPDYTSPAYTNKDDGNMQRYKSFMKCDEKYENIPVKEERYEHKLNKDFKDLDLTPASENINYSKNDQFTKYQSPIKIKLYSNQGNLETDQNQPQHDEPKEPAINEYFATEIEVKAQDSPSHKIVNEDIASAIPIKGIIEKENIGIHMHVNEIKTAKEYFSNQNVPIEQYNESVVEKNVQNVIGAEVLVGAEADKVQLVKTESMNFDNNINEEETNADYNTMTNQNNTKQNHEFDNTAQYDGNEPFNNNQPAEAYPSTEYAENETVAQPYDPNDDQQYATPAVDAAKYDTTGQYNEPTMNFDETAQNETVQPEANEQYKHTDQYDPNIEHEQTGQYDPNAQYDQTEQYDPNAQYDQTEQYDQNAQNDQTGQYDPNAQNDQTEQYDPNAQYNETGQYEPNAQYGETGQYDPNAQYDQTGQYDPNAQYDQTGNYDPNTQYDQTGQYDPNSQYDQTGQYDPNAQYDPNGEYVQQYDETGQIEQPNVYADPQLHGQVPQSEEMPEQDPVTSEEPLEANYEQQPAAPTT